ncbi:putative reverse transcriptase [Metarhizium anisopliae]
MAYALRSPPTIADRNMAVITNNKSVVIGLGNPRQQSGQVYVRLIYEAIEKLRERGNRVAIEWIPVSGENEMLKVAKTEARELPKKEPRIPKDAVYNAEHPKTEAEGRTILTGEGW